MGIKLLSIRWKYAPTPMGCRWCGTEAHLHAQVWVPSKKWHGYVVPTKEQIEARLRVKMSRRPRLEVDFNRPLTEGRRVE